MRILVKILYCLLIFFTAMFIAFYFEEKYRAFYRSLLKYFLNDDLVFKGKNFHIFASYQFLLSFGAYCVLFFLITKAATARRKIVLVFLSIFCFFVTTIIWAKIGSTAIILNRDSATGKPAFSYNTPHYDLIFISSLTVALLPLVIQLLIVTIPEKQSRNSSLPQ